ncbi:carbon-monoxide dehydrogenase medium subunit [Sedimentibacter acidaminivorans]|uniref:Carbon-monoxide dehydrogenase medium subunit n=1 Tax=Sedimentibacter acidaminivorans TaxID=913099 RepID=A0ABS4GI89_9FIRM|nr:xanthine dehydrogenase family protein subunit M [Sedimentibacter acidaminivorans]MBP1927418.1 carbon-monoxide dehydrogenase medium subunit [Sedimentibacter acidaminivorans]
MNILNNFEYFKPKTKSEALELVKNLGDKAKILAGGTDLIIMMKEKMIKPEAIIDIGDIDELKGIECKEGCGAEIKACTTIEYIESSSELAKKYPALTFAASQLGSKQVRVMATIGGNSCHSSPAAETPTPLSALGAKVVISSLEGDRELPIEGFIHGNRKNDLKPGEILSKFILPEPVKNSACRYGNIGLRNAMEIDAVNMAVNIELDEDKATIKNVKLVMGSVAIKPLVSEKVPTILNGRKLNDELVTKVGEAAQSEAKPISDVRASAEYRTDVIGALARRLVKESYEAAREA